LDLAASREDPVAGTSDTT